MVGFDLAPEQNVQPFTIAGVNHTSVARCLSACFIAGQSAAGLRSLGVGLNLVFIASFRNTLQVSDICYLQSSLSVQLFTTPYHK